MAEFVGGVGTELRGAVAVWRDPVTGGVEVVCSAPRVPLIGGEADRLAELLHRAATPGQPPATEARPATCGQCKDGLVDAKGCTCGSPGYPDPHEPLCGTEPCPNGCWNLLHPEAPSAGRVLSDEEYAELKYENDAAADPF